MWVRGAMPIKGAYLAVLSISLKVRIFEEKAERSIPHHLSFFIYPSTDNTYEMETHTLIGTRATPRV